MKYFAILYTSGVGGVWTVVKESLPELKKNYDVHLILFTRNSELDENVIDFLEIHSIKYTIININANNGWLFDLKRRLKVKVINRIIGIDPAIVHSHDSFSSSSYLPYLKKSNRYLFCTFHGTLFGDSSLLGCVQNWVNKNVRIRLLDDDNIHLISCDPLNVPKLQSYFGRAVCVDTSVNGVAPVNIHKVKQKNFIVGYISRFHPLKNWHLVADACLQLSQDGYNVKVLFAGTGECDKEVKEWCAKHSYITIYMGFCSDIRNQVLPKVDLHVLPTEYPEGLPMIILECMAAGIPSVTTAVGSCAYAVKNGVNGTIIKPNVNEITCAIKKYIDDATFYQTHSNQCIKYWRECFSATSMALRYKSIFDKYIF